MAVLRFAKGLLVIAILMLLLGGISFLLGKSHADGGPIYKFAGAIMVAGAVAGFPPAHPVRVSGVWRITMLAYLWIAIGGAGA